MKTIFRLLILIGIISCLLPSCQAADFWDSNNEMANGLSGLTTSGRCAAAIWDDNGTLNMLRVKNGLYVYGHTWNGTGWETDTSLVNGLNTPWCPGLLNDLVPTVWYMDDKWNLVFGTEGGSDPPYFGYDWNGTGWETNTTLYSGLITSGSPEQTKPTTFYDGNWKLILAVYSVGFYGYDWNGTGWTENSSIVAGLGSVPEDRHRPYYYEVDGEHTLFIGHWNSGILAYTWNGTSWESNSTLVSGITGFTYDTFPSVFEYDSKLHLISGDSNSGTWLGFTEYESISYFPPNPINLANSTYDLRVNFTFVIGSGNVTDSFNISTNNGSGVIWNNGSLNLFSDTSTNPRGYVEIIVHAYNNSGGGTLSTGYLTDNVTIPNNPISITNTSDWYDYEGSTIFVNYDATDIDGDTPTFSCSRIDLFTNFNTTTGEGDWSTLNEDDGTYYVDFGVSDGYGSSDNYTMTITVLDKLVFGGDSFIPIKTVLPTPTLTPTPTEPLLEEEEEWKEEWKEAAPNIFEEILIFIGKAFSWSFILAVYFGAFVASIILMRENEDLNDTKYNILFFGTIGWIAPLMINSIHLLPLVTQSFLLNVIIFAVFGFVAYAVLNIFNKGD